MDIASALLLLDAYWGLQVSNIFDLTKRNFFLTVSILMNRSIIFRQNYRKHKKCKPEQIRNRTECFMSMSSITKPAEKLR